MTYDFHGSWDQNKAHHSSLNSKDNEKDDTMYIVSDLFFVDFDKYFQFLQSSLGFCYKILSKTGHATKQNDDGYRYIWPW